METRDYYLYLHDTEAGLPLWESEYGGPMETAHYPHGFAAGEAWRALDERWRRRTVVRRSDGRDPSRADRLGFVLALWMHEIAD